MRQKYLISSVSATNLIVLLEVREEVSKIRKSIVLTKITAAQNEVALSYHSVRRLYFLPVIFVVTILY